MVYVIRSCVLAWLAFGSAANAGPEAFSPGPIIDDYGPAAVVDAATEVSGEATFKIAFDVSDAAETGAVSRQLGSVARLLNMHAKAGISPDSTQAAIVVHGAAAIDLVNDARYGADNANAELIAALIKAGVSVQLCGQTAAYRDIDASDLLPGVTLSISAMTAHAVLQQQGYTLNPF